MPGIMHYETYGFKYIFLNTPLSASQALPKFDPWEAVKQKTL